MVLEQTKGWIAGVCYMKGKEIFLFCAVPRMVLGAHSTSYPMDTGMPFPRVKTGNRLKLTTTSI
jgi:hypothetical protein